MAIDAEGRLFIFRLRPVHIFDGTALGLSDSQKPGLPGLPGTIPDIRTLHVPQRTRGWRRAGGGVKLAARDPAVRPIAAGVKAGRRAGPPIGDSSIRYVEESPSSSRS